ncbi:MAG: hydroxyphenylacetyl-CoA thioesterase PaaI [Pseudomonadales bacterium]
MTRLDPQQLAEAASAAMYERDPASQGMGIQLEKVAPGYAEMKMQIREEMVNGHEICHGGYIFSLADSTFAFACNSYNFNTVASGARIEYLRPAKLGDELTATGREAVQSGRSGVYDVEVHNQSGDIIALFRGNSTRIKGYLIPDAAE